MNRLSTVVTTLDRHDTGTVDRSENGKNKPGSAGILPAFRTGPVGILPTHKVHLKPGSLIELDLKHDRLGDQRIAGGKPAIS